MIEGIYDIILIILECKVFLKRSNSLYGMLDSSFM